MVLNGFLVFLLFFQFGNERVHFGVEFSCLLGYVCVPPYPRKFCKLREAKPGAESTRTALGYLIRCFLQGDSSYVDSVLTLSS